MPKRLKIGKSAEIAGIHPRILNEVAKLLVIAHWNKVLHVHNYILAVVYHRTGTRSE